METQGVILVVCWCLVCVVCCVVVAAVVSEDIVESYVFGTRVAVSYIDCSSPQNLPYSPSLDSNSPKTPPYSLILDSNSPKTSYTHPVNLHDLEHTAPAAAAAPAAPAPANRVSTAATRTPPSTRAGGQDDVSLNTPSNKLAPNYKGYHNKAGF